MSREITFSFYMARNIDKERQRGRDKWQRSVLLTPPMHRPDVLADSLRQNQELGDNNRDIQPWIKEPAPFQC